MIQFQNTDSHFKVTLFMVVWFLVNPMRKHDYFTISYEFIIWKCMIFVKKKLQKKIQISHKFAKMFNSVQCKYNVTIPFQNTDSHLKSFMVAWFLLNPIS